MIDILDKILYTVIDKLFLNLYGLIIYTCKCLYMYAFVLRFVDEILYLINDFCIRLAMGNDATIIKLGSLVLVI